MTRPPGFAEAFKPGAPITNENNYAEFYRFHPRPDGLSDAEYGKQLQVRGLAVHLTSDAVRDVALFKASMDKARANGIPVIVTTGPITMNSVPTDIEIEQAKVDALRAARASTS